MKTFLKVLLTLLILGGLSYGGYYAYTRYFAEVPQEGTVYVQSVSTITGVGPAGSRSRYSGVVEAKNVVKVDPDKDLTVKECFVSAGDKVKKGAPLFSYDVESMQIAFEQLQLDIMGLENGIQTGLEKAERLKTKLDRAAEYKKYEIQMDIQTQELDIRKKEYELTGKRKQAANMEAALQNATVRSPVTGTVRSVKSTQGGGQDYGDGSQDTAYITIVAGNDYCVKGTVSEQTIHTLQEGMDVRILSRINDDVWPGRIYKINTEETKQNSNRYYYYDGGSGEQASKYEFFVELDSSEGLLMGQHVYIELGADSPQVADALLLPGYYVVETEDKPFVYAANENSRIEKRAVVLGDRDEDNGTVAILEGLSYLDRIAFPDESVQVGMLASETAYVPEDMGLMEPGMDMGIMNGEMPEGEFIMDGMDLGEIATEPLPEAQTDIPEGGPIG
ncbi:MAG: HlyD family efflux transporter periplasmic adaptor subunit [Clostridia bacterium]|nr:HlyD family efflux transporter periplasmic adaptor subunit [Clostridia bacterium]